MGDEFVEVTEQSWFSRLMSSIVGVLIGLVLFIVAFPVLWWNEGRAVTTYRSLKEGAAAVISVAADSVEAGNEGKLVHITGDAKTDEVLTDPQFGISANAIKLVRTAEMYQWKERTSTRTKKKMGGGTRKTKTYHYDRAWSSSRIDSSGFKVREGHENPGQMPYKGSTLKANNVTLGAFRLSPSLISKISGATGLNVTEEDAAKLPDALRAQLSVSGGGFYMGANPGTPEIGDVRVKFSAVNPKVVSLVAQQKGASFQAYQTKAGKAVELLESGQKGADEMFAAAQRKNTILTWILRGVGFLMMLIGISLVFKPIAVFGDVIPLVGSLLGAGLGLFAFLIALSLSIVTIAVAWIVVRPLLGIPLLIVAAFGMFSLFKVSRARRGAPAPAGA